LGQIPIGNPIKGVTGQMPFAGTPSNGTNAVQTLTLGGAGAGGDTFVLSFGAGAGRTTAAIPWSATNATLLASVDAALEALPIIGTGGVTTAAGTLTAGIGTITLTYTAAAAAQPMPLPTATVTTTSTLTAAVATTTPGVSATLRGMPKGTVVDDVTNGILYENQGTGTAPSWVKVSGT
jgi:hypothetical protein